MVVPIRRLEMRRRLHQVRLGSISQGCEGRIGGAAVCEHYYVADPTLGRGCMRWTWSEMDSAPFLTLLLERQHKDEEGGRTGVTDPSCRPSITSTRQSIDGGKPGPSQVHYGQDASA